MCWLAHIDLYGLNHVGLFIENKRHQQVMLQQLEVIHKADQILLLRENQLAVWVTDDYLSYLLM